MEEHDIVRPRAEERPWEELEELVEKHADADEVGAFIEALPSGETARAISRLSDEDRTQLLTTMTPDDAADLIEGLGEAQAAALIDGLSVESAAAIVQELPSNTQADVLGDLAPANAAAILEAMEPGEADDLRRLFGYADNVAGGLMVTECLRYQLDSTVRDVITDLRDNAEEYRDYQVQYAYTVDAVGRLVGVLRLRDLLFAPRSKSVQELMIPEPVTMRDDSSLEALDDFFDRHHYFAVPVVDAEGRLLGVVRRASVEEAMRDQNEDDYRKSQGIVREELRTMPLMLRSTRRLSWLSVNIVLNIFAASVIAFYQETLASVIALAVFLPIISDMSGCSGNQAVAVTMRELALGLLKPTEVMFVLGKELMLGLVNGLALGLLIGLVAWAWKGNPYLGLVVGTALLINTMIAVCLGGAIPLILKRFGKDPALASGPILTTVTDMCGFFLVLSMAASMLGKLTDGA